MLTLVRLIFSPLVIPLLLVYLLPLNIMWLNVILALIFLALSTTDFFDGYLARKYDQVTSLGKILDPLADKFLTYSALIALLAAGKIYFYWVILLIGREFFILGVRNVALAHTYTIAVSLLGKVKTIFMMICITYIIINPYQELGLQAFRWNAIEFALLSATALFSLISAQQYYNELMRKFRAQRAELEDEVYHDRYE